MFPFDDVVINNEVFVLFLHVSLEMVAIEYFFVSDISEFFGGLLNHVYISIGSHAIKYEQDIDK